MRRVKDFNDALIMDSANVAGIFNLKDSFEEKGTVDWFENNSLFKDKKFARTDWDDVKMDSKGEKYICKRTCITKSYVDWFIKICKVFYGVTKIELEHLLLYECHLIDYPCVIAFRNLGMVLAPRVDSEGKNTYDFKPYVEEQKKDETP